MNTKTMEGIAGAWTNMNLLNTPMRIFKEARQKGDVATMERAMGYVGEYSDKAEEYKEKADIGMKEEASQTREKIKLQCEEAVKKRREEWEKMEEETQGDQNVDIRPDTVKISEEGIRLLKNNTDLSTNGSDEIKVDVGKAPVTYTKTGEIVPAQPGASVMAFV